MFGNEAIGSLDIRHSLFLVVSEEQTNDLRIYTKF